MPDTAEETTTIAALREGAALDGVYACSRRERLTTRAGAPYLSLELRDRSGAIAARVFRDADFLAGRFDRGDLVRVRGRVERFRDELQVDVADIRRASEPARAIRPTSCPRAYRDVEELDGFLEHLAREVYDEDLRRLRGGVLRRRGFSRGRSAARRARAAATTPTWAGCSSTRSRWRRCAVETCALHVRLNSDLLIAAALLHDVGKTREFEYGADISLSSEGRLLGHLVIGQQMISERARARPRPRREAARAAATACSPTTGPTACRGGGSGRPRRSRCSA